MGDDPNLFSIVLVSQLSFSICAVDLISGYCTFTEIFCLDHVLLFKVDIDIVLMILHSNLLLLG